jgi:HK97 family phage major capsid protein
MEPPGLPRPASEAIVAGAADIDKGRLSHATPPAAPHVDRAWPEEEPSLSKRIEGDIIIKREALVASQLTIVNLLRKRVDKALFNGNAGANITGLIPQAGTTIQHSRFVVDGVLNSTTTVTSATAAFVAGDVGSSISGAGIPAGATIASVTNATAVVISVAATATGGGVTLTITVPESILDQMTDALTAAQDAYADPKFWIVNAQTIGVLRKLKDTLGRPLLAPDLTVQGSEQLLGRTIIPAPAGRLPHGTALLVDPRTIYVAIDLTGYMRILIETYAANDQTWSLVVSRFDAGCTIPAGLVVLSGLGPN